MKKLLLAGAVLGLTFGGAGAVGANNSVTNPSNLENHPALFGLCTAWANNGNGRENGRPGDAPPFAALQKAAADNGQSVEQYCAGVTPSNGKGQGRP